MRVTGVIAALFATLAAAESADVQREEFFAAGIIYRQPNFRGQSRVLEVGRCVDLRGPLYDNVRSIRVSGNIECSIFL
ncbi:hypothetical protein HIM_06189 [Hirsutella minnesotensis 3608]|uniref:Beta/gamma crystallin 'Greek key' domain-containing protein n=1 Tax=Hirsutella minnesotensis 3608 TaxID=1043627 RepID=A0A0F8A4Y3_9HYPO|nr:hypothetical protein HIM_06189 [Hirsutella minnesotensis 3608]